MSSITLKRVRAASESGDDVIAVTLFESERGSVCGWFIGPVRIRATGISIAYLPKSEHTLASVAVVRAIEAARQADLPLCVVDPDDLWNDAWG